MAPEPSPQKGLIAVKELSHFTVFGVANADRTQTFYQEAFGMPIRARQGPVGTGTGAPGLGIGPGVSFIMFAGGGAHLAAVRQPAAPRPSTINHVCMNMENFDKDDVTKKLVGFGTHFKWDSSGDRPAENLRQHADGEPRRRARKALRSCTSPIRTDCCSSFRM